MQAVHRRFFFVLAVVSLGCALVRSQTQAPQHPLEALTSREYWTVYDVLHSSGHVDADTFVASVLLHEPPKSEVLAWKSGDPVSRQADVVLLRKGLTIEARVDVGARQLLYWKERPDVQAPTFEAEWHKLGETIKKDPQVVAALAKRGIKDLTTVECGADPFGYFAFPELEGHRIMLGSCADTHGEDLSWGHEIEGLYVEVDAATEKVLRVIDTGSVPVPTGSTNFEEVPERPRAGTTPLEVLRPLGPSFQVANGEVTWQGWHFRFRLDPRVGPVINQAGFEDGGRVRSVLYEGSLSEFFVPYMDPALGWATRVFIDAGEFFPFGVLSELREGVDCPADASYFGALYANEHGVPVLHSRRACLYEMAPGEPTWRHDEKNEVWGRPSRVLVLRTTLVIGNYDYVIDWRFARDGSIQVAVGATGIIEVKPVKEKTATEADSGMREEGSGANSKDEYGHFVAENTVGVNHDHFISFRLDLDVDGQNNSFQADRLVRRQLTDNPRRKSIWAMEPFTARTEQDAMMDIHLERPTMWRFVNPDAKGPLGYPTGYEIMPGATAASLLDPNDEVQRAGAFSSHQLWVTPYKPDEIYAAGVYPMASKGNDGLAAWTKANRPIENTDIVAWYTLGFHHVPRAEDWPVMPTMWHDFVIRPFDFFQRNPVLDLPSAP